MNINQKIRTEARGRLRGNWGTALGLTGIWIAGVFVIALFAELGYFLVGLFTADGQMMGFTEAVNSGVLQVSGFFAVPAVCAVLAILLLAPLWLGFVRWLSFLAQGERLDAETIFYYYCPQNYVAGLKFSCAFFLRVAGWTLVCLLPGGIAAGAASLVSAGMLALSQAAAEVLEMLGGLLELGGLVLFFNRVLQYFAAPFLFVTRGDATGSITQSIRVMEGFKSAMFGLMFSFFGWLLLCAFAFPLLYVFPYMTEALLVASKWLVYNHEHRPEPVVVQGYGYPPQNGATFGSQVPPANTGFPPQQQP